MEKKSIKVSIITATYNSEKTIQSCVESIFKQEYKNIENIFIDGGSTDNTVEIIKDLINLDKRTNWQIISEPDEGIYDALNKGLKLATGEIIGFVHSDDFLANKSIISNIVEEFTNDRMTDGIYGNLHYIDKFNEQRIVRTWKSCDFNAKLIRKGWMPAHPTLFLRKQVYMKYGYFNLSFKISADYDFILRIFNNNKLNVKYLPKVITKMRIGGASNISLRNIVTKSIEDYIALKKNGLKFPFLVLVQKNISKISQFVR